MSGDDGEVVVVWFRYEEECVIRIMGLVGKALIGLDRILSHYMPWIIFVRFTRSVGRRLRHKH